MKGDYSRDSFNPASHFTRVLMQQGRVLLDADWNEQAAILLHYLQTLAADLIGPHGGPAQNAAFEIVVVPSANDPDRISDLRIGAGHYYVDGILCENEGATAQPGIAHEPTDKPWLPRKAENDSTAAGNWRNPDALTLDTSISYFEQPDYTLSPDANPQDRLPDVPFFVYLDVWERHLAALEGDFQEVALGGPDTAARAKVVWQVRVRPLTDFTSARAVKAADITCDSQQVEDLMFDLLDQLQPRNLGMLLAMAKEPEGADSTTPCIISPDARYRGAENQLYRVEIHRGGGAGDERNGATFKWSRENGSVVFPIESVSDQTVTVGSLGRDDRFGLEVGDWVEIVDDDYTSHNQAGPLLQVDAIDPVEMQVILRSAPDANVGRDASKHPMLRRWDQQRGQPTVGGLQLATDGAALVIESNTQTGWLMLEDGIQIQFLPGGNYRTGDYWLIPARTETKDVVWPTENDKPLPLPPHGVEHHYAPLAVVYLKDAAGLAANDLRHKFGPASGCCPRIELVFDPPQPSKAIFRVTANVSGAPPNLRYNWTISTGLFVSGNQISTITVDAAGSGDKFIEVSVTIDGLPPGCPRTASVRRPFAVS